METTMETNTIINIGSRIIFFLNIRLYLWCGGYIIIKNYV
jgi:hypothetical protein